MLRFCLLSLFVIYCFSCFAQPDDLRWKTGNCDDLVIDLVTDNQGNTWGVEYPAGSNDKNYIVYDSEGCIH